MTTVLRFATIFVSGKSDASPTQVRRSANACERLRMLADACERKRNDLASPPGPLDPNLKTGTLLLRIREKKASPPILFWQGLCDEVKLELFLCLLWNTLMGPCVPTPCSRPSASRSCAPDLASTRLPSQKTCPYYLFHTRLPLPVYQEKSIVRF